MKKKLSKKRNGKSRGNFQTASTQHITNEKKETIEPWRKQYYIEESTRRDGK